MRLGNNVQDASCHTVNQYVVPRMTLPGSDSYSLLTYMESHDYHNQPGQVQWARESCVNNRRWSMAVFGKMGTSIEEEGGMETEIAKRVGAGWMNWKKCSGVLCDKKMPVKLKGKVYRTVVRPAMLYGAETWATTKRQESRIEVNEMRMLRWMCGVTRKDKIRNEHIRGTTKVAQASRKITERRLKWYGHVMRMEEDHVVKRVMTKAIPGKRKRGRPKTRWKDVCKRDMQTVV